ncbi:SCO2521 family protein [Actinacidiphila alni]|uniref:SCO2521 family protein n=1 Tax=Actinacidiphila alni TaxID=380248 RepID=UPI0033F49E12
MSSPIEGGSDEPLMMIGEVHTGLVLSSRALAAEQARTLLDFVPGQPVRVHERPVGRCVSADVLHGVDCPVHAGSGARTRGIGTLAARARVVGGRVLQGSARAVLVPGGRRRLDWGHYLERPGVIEVAARGGDGELPARFLDGAGPGALDPGAVAARLMARVQANALLDLTPAFRARRTRLRWAVTLGAGRFHGGFTLTDAEGRRLLLALPALPGVGPGEIAALCEDVALHDWLLGTVIAVVDRAAAGGPGAAGTRRLRPAVDHLVHLWMPGAAVVPELVGVWERLETRPGFTRQWEACVSRIRDQLALRTLELLAAVPVADG